MLSSSSSDKKKLNDNKKIRAHLFIQGKVQGVYFRQNTMIMAARYGVTGWVRNLKDGGVEVILEGSEMDVRKIIEWCRVGPPKATVNDFVIEYENYIGEFQEFKVIY
jgi:acylphosphatase